MSPNVKSSTLEFEIGNNFIQFPLNYIKGVGNAVATDIMEMRDKLNYKDLTEFCKSMNYKFVTKRMLKHLIHSRALDCFRLFPIVSDCFRLFLFLFFVFEADRSRLIQSIDLLRDCVKRKLTLL
ncbi:MAG: helix-hairpin-helix domain-containing protein [Candidatus Hodgkinia cicadicola]